MLTQFKYYWYTLLNTYKRLFFFFAITASHLAYSTTINVPAPRSVFDISHDYHIKLINLALNQVSGSDYQVRTLNNVSFSQGRAEAELKKGDTINLYWFGARKELDQKLRAIPIPTTRGLIGFRKFIIRKESTSTFSGIKSIEDLQKMIACQGEHWPDTKILQDAKLPVTTSVQYESLFKMVKFKRCDYFPRGYHDAENELVMRKRSHPELTSFPGILLHYPFAVYFYTNKENEQLGKDLEEGMHKLAQLGEIEAHMKRHDLTKSVFPLKNESNTVHISIPNNYITPNPLIKDGHYWIQSYDFKID